MNVPTWTCTVLIAWWHAMKTAASTVYKATATMESSTQSSVQGTVEFFQIYGSDCVHVNATIFGLPAGNHGFHVHQYGDLSSDTDLSSLGAHFVPYCTDRRGRRLDLDYIETPDSGADAVGTQCYNDSVHGLPPSQVRQSGDMGNILSENGVASYNADLCQSKMSLYDPVKSILGRSVVVHESPDSGEQPYGNAGNPVAAGIIGLSDVGSDENAAVSADVPQVSRVMCYLRGDFDGPVLLEKAFLSSSASLSAALSVANPISEDSTHSFHFHTFGDLSSLGPIWQSADLEISELLIPGGEDVVRECSSFEANNDLLDFVGRTLTIHSGPTSDSATVAAGLCGLANPNSEVLCTITSSSTGKVSISFSLLGVVLFLYQQRNLV